MSGLIIEVVAFFFVVIYAVYWRLESRRWLNAYRFKKAILCHDFEEWWVKAEDDYQKRCLIRYGPKTKSNDEQTLEIRERNKASHRTLWTPEEHLRQHVDDDVLCPVCDEGKGVCRACSAMEEQLGKFSCEDFIKINAYPKSPFWNSKER